MSSRFVDIDLSFGRHPVSGDVSALTDRAAVAQSVRNLLSMREFDKPYHPEIRSGVAGMMFEPGGADTASSIRRLVREVIANNEPRFSVDRVDVDFDRSLGSIRVDITGRIVNVADPVTISEVLVRTR